MVIFSLLLLIPPPFLKAGLSWYALYTPNFLIFYVIRPRRDMLSHFGALA